MNFHPPLQKGKNECGTVDGRAMEIKLSKKALDHIVARHQKLRLILMK